MDVISYMYDILSIKSGNQELWELFTKSEEYNSQLMDRDLRFPSYFSKYANTFEPSVSKLLLQMGEKFEYPENRNFALCLTHDIDIISMPISSFILNVGKSVKRKEIDEIRKHMRILSNLDNLYSNFKYIMELEEKYDGKSTFYFMASEDTYKLSDISDSIQEIIENGWEIGLHGSYNAYNNLNLIKKEKKLLEDVVNREVIGYRNHRLRFSVPNTWELLHRAHLKYDSTFGYADRVGFRNGMCHPFRPFNLDTNRQIPIVELPLIIMDGTLCDYMRIDKNISWKVIKNLIDIVEKYNGVITILWHNTSMSGDLLYLYKCILDYCYKKNAWITNAYEIYEWFCHDSKNKL